MRRRPHTFALRCRQEPSRARASWAPPARGRLGDIAAWAASIEALVGVAAVAALVGACTLPQNQASPAAADAAGSDAASTGAWKILRLADLAASEDQSAPGADIDAIMVTMDGELVSAGCTDVTLFGEDTARFGGNPHVDPAQATLNVREQSETGGFVSLGGGTLVCELPLAVRAGDTVTVWEVDADGADGYRVSLARDAAGDEVLDLGEHQGTATLTVP